MILKPVRVMWRGLTAPFRGVVEAKRPIQRDRPPSLRVLMVTEGLARGGAERQMFALTHGLLARGHQVEIFELWGTDAGQARFAQEFADAGVAIRCAADFAAVAAEPPMGDLDLQTFAAIIPSDTHRVCAALAQVLARFRPDVVKCWSDRANLVGGSTALAHGIARVALGFRTMPSFWLRDHREPFANGYRAMLARPGVVGLASSQAVKRDFESWFRIEGAVVEVVYNGFLPQTLTPPDGRADGSRSRARFGIPDGALVVGNISRFSPEKDMGRWLEAAAAIVAVRPDTHFLLAGYGLGISPYEVAAKGRQLGLGDRLVMPGAVTDVAPVYAAMDILMAASQTESISNVLIEAQAAGLAVVAPAVGGTPEAVLDGVTGFLVATRAAQDLADAVLRVADDADFKRRAAVRGPQFVAERFGQDRMVEAMLAAFGARSGNK